MSIYTVQPGDSIASIASRFGLSAERIIADNGIETPDQLAVGQALILRFPSQTITVQPGDTLTSIADANGTSVNTLFRNNPTLEGLPELIPGEEIVIQFADEEPLGTFYVNGYTVEEPEA